MRNKEKARGRQVTECHMYNTARNFFSKMICYQNLFQKPMFTHAHLPDIVLVTKLKKGREI